MNRVVDGIYTDRQNKTKSNKKNESIVNCYQLLSSVNWGVNSISPDHHKHNKTKQLQLIISLFFYFFKCNQQPQEMCLA